jgi:hypothetical protein
LTILKQTYRGTQDLALRDRDPRDLPEASAAAQALPTASHPQVGAGNVSRPTIMLRFGPAIPPLPARLCPGPAGGPWARLKRHTGPLPSLRLARARDSGFLPSLGHRCSPPRAFGASAFAGARHGIMMAEPPARHGVRARIPGQLDIMAFTSSSSAQGPLPSPLPGTPAAGPGRTFRFCFKFLRGSAQRVAGRGPGLGRGIR